MTRVPKAKGRREYGVAARGRAAKSDPGAEFPLRDGTFFGDAEICPYKPHVGAFVGEDGIGHIANRDMSDTFRRNRLRRN